MTTRREVESKREAFKAWLTAHGASVMEPTNEWELVRFGQHSGASVIYGNARGGTSFTGEAKAAWDAYRSGQPWAGAKRTRRKPMTPTVRTLLQRDGPGCFYCPGNTSDENRSVEHLVPVAHGDPNHISNLVLAHKQCNARAGHLSAMEKIRLRERLHAHPGARTSQQVLKAEGDDPDATDRERSANASPVGGPMGAGQPAAAGLDQGVRAA